MPDTIREIVASVVESREAWYYLRTWEREAKRAARELAWYGRRANALRKALGRNVPAKENSE